MYRLNASLPAATDVEVQAPAPSKQTIGTFSSGLASTRDVYMYSFLREDGRAVTMPSLTDSSHLALHNGWIPGWRDVRGDVLNVVGAPLQLDRTDALRLVGAGGLVAGIVAGLDGPAARRVPQSSGTNVAAVATPASAPGRWYDHLGPDRVALSTVSAFAVTGLALRKKEFTRTSFNLVEAMLLTKATTGLFKGIAGRTRPYAGSSPWDVNTGAFSSQHERKSMPSGHTSRAFAIASVIAHDYPQWYVQIPAYTFAASAGVQRIRRPATTGSQMLSSAARLATSSDESARTVARDGGS